MQCWWGSSEDSGSQQLCRTPDRKGGTQPEKSRAGHRHQDHHLPVRHTHRSIWITINQGAKVTLIYRSLIYVSVINLLWWFQSSGPDAVQSRENHYSQRLYWSLLSGRGGGHEEGQRGLWERHCCYECESTCTHNITPLDQTPPLEKFFKLQVKCSTSLNIEASKVCVKSWLRRPPQSMHRLSFSLSLQSMICYENILFSMWAFFCRVTKYSSQIHSVQ